MVLYCSRWGFRIHQSCSGVPVIWSIPDDISWWETLELSRSQNCLETVRLARAVSRVFVAPEPLISQTDTLSNFPLLLLSGLARPQA